MIKVKDGYGKLIDTAYLGSESKILKSDGGDVGYSTTSSASTLVQRNASGQIESDLATGTSPFKVTSTTVVSNLNADLLDGVHKEYLLTALSSASKKDDAEKTNNLSITVGGTIKTIPYLHSTYLSVQDIRDTSPTPNDYCSKRVSSWFNNSDKPTTNISWYSGISVAGWTTGYRVWQLASNSSTVTDGSLFYRGGLSDTWEAWRTILDSVNYTDYFKNYYNSSTKRDPNTVLAGPSSGTTTAAATFRKLVSDDIPNLDTGKLTSGVLSVARGGTGQNTLVNAANSLLNSLSTGSSNPVDNDYYISQYSGGGTTNTTYHRRPVKYLYNYIKSKLDSVYLPLSGGTVTDELILNNSYNSTDSITKGLVIRRTTSDAESVRIYTNDYGPVFEVNQDEATCGIKFDLRSNATEKPDSTTASNSSITFGNASGVSTITADKFTGSLVGNADSATKLVTARTIWGQSFNGTGNVDGKLTITSGGMQVTGTAYFGGGTTYYFGSAGSVNCYALTSNNTATFKNNTILNNSTDPYLTFKDTAASQEMGKIYYATSYDSDNKKYKTGFFLLRQWSYTADTATKLNYYESYLLPNVTTGLTSNKSYYILTSKNYTDYLGYIGTTAVQSSSKAQALTGITSITASGNYTSISTTDTTNRCVKVGNKNGEITLYAATNRGLHDSTTGTWVIGTNGTNTWSQQGNFGIGTTSPSEKLHVSGNIKTSGKLITPYGSLYSSLSFWQPETGGWARAMKALAKDQTTELSAIGFYGGDDGLLWTYLGGTYESPAITILPDKKVGIGTNTPSQKLEVSGNVKATKFVNASNSSSKLLRSDGGDANFNWSGQSGQPKWLWGGDYQHNYYVYNPSNFSVKYATSSGTASTASELTSNFSFGGGQNADKYFYVGYLPVKSSWRGYHSVWVFTGSETSWGGILDISFRAGNGTLTLGNANIEWLSLTDPIFNDSIYLTYDDTTEEETTTNADGETETTVIDVRNYNIYIKIPASYKSTQVTTIYETTNLTYSKTLVDSYKGTLYKQSSGSTAGSLDNLTATTSNEAYWSEKLAWYNRLGNASGYAGDNTGFPATGTANGILWLSTSGTYGHQLGFSGNGRIYQRYIQNGNFPTTANGGSWNKLAWTSEIPTNYVTTNTTQTISGAKTFTATTNTFGGGDSATYLTVDRNSTNPAYVCFKKNGNLVGYLGVSNDKVPVFNDGNGPKTILHSGNYTSTLDGRYYTETEVNNLLKNYLPLTGGKLTGTSTTPLEVDTSNTGEIGIRLKMSNVAKSWIGYSPSEGVCLYQHEGPHRLGIKPNGTPRFDSHTLIHSGNYSTYLPILNSASTHATNTSVIYAPTTAGTKGQVLTSSGGVPTWSDQVGNSDKVDGLHSYQLQSIVNRNYLEIYDTTPLMASGVNLQNATLVTAPDNDAPYKKVWYTEKYVSYTPSDILYFTPGETICIESWIMRPNGATGTAGTYYLGLCFKDKNGLQVNSNAGTVYFGNGDNPDHTAWTCPTDGVWYRCYAEYTIPKSHTPYTSSSGTSDGGGYYSATLRLLINYQEGTIPTYFGGCRIYRKISTETVGSSTNPIYLKSGTPTACSGRTVPGIKTASAATTLGWGTNNTYVPDISLLSYWNGAYTGTSSNLQYCNKGAFGAAATKSVADSVTSGSTALVTSGGVYNYVTTTNFPGLNKTGTVTSITPGTGLTNGTEETAITTSGTLNLKTASTSEIGGVKIAKDNSSYTVTTATSAISNNITSGKYYGVELDKNDKAFVYVPWTDTKVTNTLSTATKFYFAGTTSTSTATGTQYFDTNIYTSTTAGALHAKTFRRYDGSTANSTPLLHAVSNNTDITILRASYATSENFYNNAAYGFSLNYIGTGDGNANYLKLLADNQTSSTQVLSLCVDQLGNVGIGVENSTHKLLVAGELGISMHDYTHDLYGDENGNLIILGSEGIILDNTVTANYDIQPYQNNSNTLGTSALKWKNVYSTKFNDYELGDACAKSVSDSSSASAISTGTSLVTERDVYYGLPKINNSHSYTSSTSIYAPTAGGTSGYYLKGNGTTSTPVWQQYSSTPTSGSTTLITSGGVYTALEDYLPLDGGTITGLVTFGADSFSKTVKFANADYPGATAMIFMAATNDFCIRHTLTSDKSTTDLRFNNTRLQYKGNILPQATATYTLGDDSYRFKTGYFSNTLIVGETGMTGSTSGYTGCTFGSAGNIELVGLTGASGPKIDFHYNKSTSDFTTRIIENAIGQLHVYGNLYVHPYTSASGTTTSYPSTAPFYINSEGAYWTSDRRFKKNIQSPIKNALLEDETGFIRKFDWKETGKPSYGYIAQEILPIMPEAVDYDENLGKYSVNYNVAHSAAIAQLVIKIKELESEIIRLKQLIN